jgi:hypothetical protein
MKKIRKPITGVINNEWSGTLKILLGLDGDPYSYNDIIDNLWTFKTRNKKKKERVRSVLNV